MKYFSVRRRFAALGALAVVGALLPIGVAPALASQGGDDHKVTLCHRTHSETNPYVQITIDKAAVFKRGHDTHDEGPVWQPGFKAAGKRWGDVIPAFDYYATPKATTLSHYDGMNLTAEGQALLANGCQPDTPPNQGVSGELSGFCDESTRDFTVEGTFSNGDQTNVSWQLRLSTGEEIALTSSPFSQVIDAPVGTTVDLRYSTNGGDTWQLQDSVDVRGCGGGSNPEEPSGQLSGQCANQQFVVSGTFDHGDQGEVLWRLRLSTGENIALTTSPFSQIITAPAGTTVRLQSSLDGSSWDNEGEAVTVADCAPSSSVTPEGSMSTACTATGATVTIGALTSGPTWVLAVNGTDTAVSTGSVVTVAGSASLALVAVVDGVRTTVKSLTAPAACPTAQNPPPAGTRGLTVEKAVDLTVAQAGSTLTYTLVVRATGTLAQTNVVVTDRVPAGTTYVNGSATCDGGCAGTVTLTDGVLSWPLGGMAAGASRTVQFAVTVDEVEAESDGSIPVRSIRNVGAVQSAEVGSTPSNEVVTEVPAVLGVKEGKPGSGPKDSPPKEEPRTLPRTLPRTGSSIPLGAQALIASMFIALGAGLVRWSMGSGAARA